MTLTKNKMIREIGRRTRLKNREVQLMIETLVEVWEEEFVSGGRIELENFMVLEIKQVDRGINCGTLKNNERNYSAPRFIYKLIVRPSKRLKSRFSSITRS